MNLLGLAQAPAPVSGWQIGSTIATSTAAVIALVVVVINLVQRRRDRERDEARDLARAFARAKLVQLLQRPQWEALPANPAGHSAWGIPITNLDDRYLLDVTAEFWTPHGNTGDPKKPNASAPEIVAPGTKNLRIGVDFGQVGEDGSPPVLTHWRLRWEDVDGYAWCFDQYGQGRPEPFTGQPPRPAT